MGSIRMQFRARVIAEEIFASVEAH